LLITAGFAVEPKPKVDFSPGTTPQLSYSPVCLLNLTKNVEFWEIGKILFVLSKK
jgi:hypothetical protein